LRIVRIAWIRPANLGDTFHGTFDYRCLGHWQCAGYCAARSLLNRMDGSMKGIKFQAPASPLLWRKFAGLLGLSSRGTPLTMRAAMAQPLLSSSKTSASTHGKPARDALRARVATPSGACAARKKDITRQPARTISRKDVAMSFAHLLESQVDEASLPSRVEGWDHITRDGRRIK